MKKLLLATQLLLLFHSNLLAQGTVTVQFINSTILGTSVGYNVYLPASYSQNDSANYPVLYLLHGLNGDNTDWVNNGMADTMNKEIGNGAKEMIVIMPNGINAWYCNNYDSRNFRYEDFMVKELIPQVEIKYKITASKQTRAIAGLSMGGYGATFHGFTYPELYSSIYCMSGAVLVKGKEPNLQTLVNSLTTIQLQNLPPYTMEIGTKDFLYILNKNWRNVLIDKSVSHFYIERPGSHDWAFWKASLPRAVRFASDNFELVTTGILKITTEEATFCPNPANEWIRINAKLGTEIVLCSVSGHIVEKKTVANAEGSLYIGDLARGQYLIIFEEAGKRTVRNLVLQ